MLLVDKYRPLPASIQMHFGGTLIAGLPCWAWGMTDMADGLLWASDRGVLDDKAMQHHAYLKPTYTPLGAAGRGLKFLAERDFDGELELQSHQKPVIDVLNAGETNLAKQCRGILSVQWKVVLVPVEQNMHILTILSMAWDEWRKGA